MNESCEDLKNIIIKTKSPSVQKSSISTSVGYKFIWDLIETQTHCKGPAPKQTV